jgi:aryl-alcohol dehydrogenase
MARTSHARVQKIQAAVLRKQGGPLKIESLELDGPRDDEILVRIVATGICHTDIDLYDGWDGTADPIVLGHEGAGIVEQVGKKVQGVQHGDHVVLSYQSCGQCHPCLSGRPSDCQRFYEVNFGFQRLDGSNALHRSGVRGHFFGQSSFATYALATERNLVPVAKNLPLQVLAPLGCGMQTGAGAVLNSLKVSPGASVAVFGTGAVGMAAIMASRIVGADPIIGVDIIPMRLALALQLGATHTIDNRHDDVASRISEIAGGGVDYVVETTGNPKLVKLAQKVLNPNGTVAVFSGTRGPVSLTEGRTMLGIIEGDAVPQQFIPRMIELYQAGQFPFDRLIRFYDLREINRAIADAKRGDTIKPVLRVNESLSVGE